MPSSAWRWWNRIRLLFRWKSCLESSRSHRGPESGPLGLHGQPDPFQSRNPEWVLPDRNTIPHNVAFFQNLRNLLPEICHKHGLLAIGGMTALFPSREDAELNARALKALAEDKKNEAIR